MASSLAARSYQDIDPGLGMLDGMFSRPSQRPDHDALSLARSMTDFGGTPNAFTKSLMDV